VGVFVEFKWHKVLIAKVKKAQVARLRGPGQQVWLG
jgi:hypothetical protein